MPRLFVGIPLPDAVTAALSQLQPASAPGLKIVRPDQMHVTLHFIGEGDVVATRTALTSVSCPSFELEIAGVGVFPPRGKPSVLWAGVEVSEGLQELHSVVGQALGAIGFTSETRPFAPHITLARCGNRASSNVADDLLARHQGLRLPPLAVTEFWLYSSETKDAGPVYRCEQSYPLRG